MKKIFYTILLLSTMSSLIMAQATGNRNYAKRAKGNVNYNNNTYNDYSEVPQNIEPNVTLGQGKLVTLEVQILSNQKADTYVAIFNLTQMGKTVDETNRLLTDRYNGFAQELQSVGIPKDAIYLDMISFVPLYEYEKEKKIFSKTHNEVPKGFEMQQNVHIKYNDMSMMPKIMSVAAKYEIFDLVKIDYAVDNQEAVYVEMREKAVAHLVQEIELYVDRLGVDLESGYRIVGENKQVSFPVDRYSSYNAYSNVSLGGTPEKGKVQDMYKPKTMYYDKVAYDNFDIVINPTVLEPAIQFMYTMKIQIAVKDPNQPTPQHVWLTPDGDLVPIKID
ncbi:SIMPL domain-containing protein [Aureispira sp. CCB-E]|uniref:SIMPL domain-containing protein n=1 Tax=Aureispira sp. CCB-E TaxID=3051121 RepID=UPI0028687C8E|nr:SIMPL domain-containing protein [Aureispira sp. CCB-E]WMX15195.1 SIMPL domain-containing protein [Aureispira sp. CCB-E]